MSALERIYERLQAELYKPEREHLDAARREARELYDAVAAELAAKIQTCRDEVRALNWGRSRNKRPYLLGMERAQRVIEPGKEATCSDPGM